MTEIQYKNFLEAMAAIGELPQSAEQIQRALYEYVSAKMQEFTDLALVLSGMGLYTTQQRAVLTADWINLVADPEQKASIIKLFEGMLTELKHPTPLGNRLVKEMEKEGENDNERLN